MQLDSFFLLAQSMLAHTSKQIELDKFLPDHLFFLLTHISLLYHASHHKDLYNWPLLFP